MTIMTLPYRAMAASSLQLYTSAAVFLLGAFALVVPSGYSIGAVMLLLGSAWLLVNRLSLKLHRQDWLAIGALLAYTLVGMAEAWWDGQGMRGIDKPLRFLLAVPAMLLVMAYPPRLGWMWSGLAVGGIVAGAWAGWQKLVEGVERAGGYTHVIQFGNISMLLGVLCLAGLGWAVVQRYRNAWVVLLVAGALGGILGSLFSGSRGGWIGFPIVLLVLYQGYGRQLPRRAKLGLLVATVVGAALVYSVPQVGVQDRVHQAFDDVARYVSGESRTSSVGARFEMWKGATHLIMEKPIFGWGSNGYHKEMIRLGEEGFIDEGVAIFDHAHNEYIDAFAKRGIVGLTVLLGLYLIPMHFFSLHLAARDLELRSLAIAGVLLSVAYIDFGLTQVFLSHNSGVMMYAFWLAVLFGIKRAFESRLAATKA